MCTVLQGQTSPWKLYIRNLPQAHSKMYLVILNVNLCCAHDLECCGLKQLPRLKSMTFSTVRYTLLNWDLFLGYQDLTQIIIKQLITSKFEFDQFRHNMTYKLFILEFTKVTLLYGC